MRYIATVANSQYLRDYTDKPCEQACVTAPPIDNAALALRHARAMAAVIRAAKAWQRASARFERSCEADALVSTVAPILQAQLDAEKRLLAATARLVAVEKEVSR